MQKYRSENRETSAFTLIELLVTMVIMAIAGGVIVANFSSGDQLDARAAARTITADLQYAQDMAITTQDSVTVTFNIDDESYSLSNTSGPMIHPISKSTYTVSLGPKDGHGNLDGYSVDFAGDVTVTFDELGSPDNPGNIQITFGVYVYQISVAPATGKVTVSYIES